MMTKLVNPREMYASELRGGQAMARTVVCHIIQHGDKLAYRLYLCPFPSDNMIDGVPQGQRLLPEHERQAAEALFPVLKWAKAEQDFI